MGWLELRSLVKLSKPYDAERECWWDKCTSFQSPEKNAVHQLLIPKKESNYIEDNSRAHQYADKQDKSPTTPAHGILLLELLRETQCSQALDETTLYLHGEEIEQDQL